MENTYFELVKSQRESQKKYDYYFLGVILTLLSLSIQSYKPSDFQHFCYIIVFVWILLLISFLAGMYRQERINMTLLNEAEQTWMRDELAGIEQAINNVTQITKSTGEKWTPQEIRRERDKFKEMIDKINDSTTKLERKAINAYNIQKWTFVVSLILYSVLKILNYK
jgi:hypothetical protein